MKKYFYFNSGIIVLFALVAFIISSPAASAGLFDNDEQNWRRIFGEIKKINTRIVSLEMGKLKSLESSQQDLSRQIDEIINLIPNLQGTLEQNQAEVFGHFKGTNQKLGEIQSQMGDGDVNARLDEIISKLRDIDERLKVF